MTGYIDEDRAVSRLSEIVALECGVHPAAARQIRIAAALHDIGKQRIAASIINKPGKLDAREFEIMKTHTALGASMLKSIQGELGEKIRLTALYHHENWDGSGYFGKYADELPVYVPIVSICDVAVALVSERPYKSAWPPREMIAYIQGKAGTQFNPALVRIFLSLIRHDNRVPAIFGNRGVGALA
ncbi:MAG: HD domain-containing protein [Oscillospiraceae bacterium]|jgi:putative two-component system response regulator|nr:HD domain-containing protein [Oscillospiraceae bacterium]